MGAEESTPQSRRIEQIDDMVDMARRPIEEQALGADQVCRTMSAVATFCEAQLQDGPENLNVVQILQRCDATSVSNSAWMALHAASQRERFHRRWQSLCTVIIQGMGTSPAPQ